MNTTMDEKSSHELQKQNEENERKYAYLSKRKQNKLYIF